MMSETTMPPAVSVHTGEAAKKRMKKRHNAEKRLRAYGIIAISLAALALVALLYNVFARAVSVRTEHYITVAADISKDENDFLKVVKTAAREAFPFASGRTQKREVYGLFSDGAADDMRDAAEAGTLEAGSGIQRRFLLSDSVDLYLRGVFGTLEEREPEGALTLSEDGKTVLLQSTAADFNDALGLVKAGLAQQSERLRREAERQSAGIETLTARLPSLEGPELDDTKAQIEGFKAKRAQLSGQADALDATIMAQGGERLKLTNRMPSFFVRSNDGILKLTEVSSTTALGKPLIPLSGTAAGAWSLLSLDRPEIGRPVKDFQVALVEDLRAKDRIEEVTNWRFFTSSDSTQPEIAGIYGALIGSMWTMLVTFSLAFPIGVMAAIYLEEFAPRNRWTDFIEVNINNLAAVPSIVFGLLGLAVFLHFFGVPRSSPLAGGLVLALMTLPTIIIASRASIRAVPPSIRSAALGLGASKVQTTFHHVLPLAMPGILTGTIIGMAQALGETAPLLMIGMVAFITAVPEGITDSATVLPVQVFNWANASERAFDMRTAAAIAVLLGFLVVMNMIAIILRKRFERRW